MPAWSPARRTPSGFATGTHVWYPLFRARSTRDLPRKLKTLAVCAHWLHATLTVKSSKLTTDSEGEVDSPPPPASGMFIINPPHTLKADLQRRAAADGRTAGPGPQCRLHLEHGG
jgi:23S rRNA (adenine2030-N6)-methyltransferase